MPRGKAAGERCIHLDPDLRCALFGKPERPAACAAFQPEEWLCGTNRDEALQRIAVLELESGSS